MLNTDVAVKNSPRIGGLGGAIRNNKGEWIIGYIGNMINVTPTIAEIYALKQRLQLAIQFDIKPLSINLDSLEAIQFITNGHLPHNNLILECRH